jgi:hypothetical protein
MKTSYYNDNEGMLWEPNDDKDALIWRYSGNPLFDMSKMNSFWHICNSAVAMVDGKYIGVFRCEDKRVNPTCTWAKATMAQTGIFPKRK